MTDAALGNLALRYSDAKRRQAALVAALESHGRLLRDLSHNLTYMSSSWGEQFLQIPGDYPDRATLEAQLADWRAVSQDLQLWQQQLAEAGVDLS